MTLRIVGLQIDAQTVLDYVHAHPLLAKTPIVQCSPTANRGHSSSNFGLLQILYGQSIGGAVSIDLAYRNPHAVSNPLFHALEAARRPTTTV